tara:strand:+ start:461 stop:871 length:411 start_codon:yes stop_codon:yes gene_type:complete
MGNRAVIAFVADDGTQDKDLCLGIYLHWNGGRDSVEGFLEYAKKQGLRSGDYGVARLCQIIGNTFGGTLSLGVDVVRNLDYDNFDNGLYWVDKEFNIVSREYITDDFKEQQQYKLDEFVAHVAKANDKFFAEDKLR